MSKGLIHIYCGDGKGKTTAAVGLAVRNVGAGGKVLMFQFMKGGSSSEIKVLKKLDGITIIDGIKNMKFVWNMTDDEKNEAKAFYIKQLNDIKIKISNNEYTMLVLDEIMSAVSCGFVPIDLLLEMLKNIPKGLEVVMTGRDPNKQLLDVADYVSEIKKIKHPFDNGVESRRGIEF